MKTFAQLSLWETADVLIRGKMDDGTPIDPETAKDSLSRVLPMMLPIAQGDRSILDDLKRSKGTEIYDEWLKKVEMEEALVAGARKILGQ